MCLPRSPRKLDALTWNTRGSRPLPINIKPSHQVLDRCLELEGDVAQIPQLKRQVDRYRRSHTDMEVANREQVRATN